VRARRTGCRTRCAAVDEVVAARDAYWLEQLQSTAQAVATAMWDYYRDTPVAVSDGQRAAELALGVVRDATTTVDAA
jgi:hypothetical protein